MKLNDLFNDATQVILAEQPHFWEHWASLVPEVKNIFDKRWPDMKNDAKWESLLPISIKEARRRIYFLCIYDLETPLNTLITN